MVFIAHGAAKLHHHLILSSVDKSLAEKFRIIGKIDCDIPALVFIKGTMFIDFKSFLDVPLQDLFNRHLEGLESPEDLEQRFKNLCEHVGDDEDKKAIVLEFIKFSNVISSLHLYPLFKWSNQTVFEESLTNFEPTLSDQVLPWITRIHTHFPLLQNIEDVVELYNMSRTFVLSAIVESFVRYCISNLGITPLQSIGIGRFSFEAAYSRTPEGYEHLQDEKMIRLFGLPDSIRGKLLAINFNYWLLILFLL